MCLILLSICRSTWLIYLLMSSSLAAINTEEFFGFHMSFFWVMSQIFQNLSMEDRCDLRETCQKSLYMDGSYTYVHPGCIFLSLLLHFMFYSMNKSVQRTGLVLLVAWNSICYNISGSCVHFSWDPEDRLFTGLTLLPVWQVGPQGTWQSFGYCRVIIIWIG